MIVSLAMLTIGALGAALAPRPHARCALAIDAAYEWPSHSARRSRRWRVAPKIEPDALASWCDALARALRGGATLRHALRSVAPPTCVASDIAPALLALDRGTSVSAALDYIDARSADLDLVLVVVRACAEHGGPAAEPIDRAAAALRQRAALAGERRTNSAQARMSALVMTSLPGAMLALLMVTSHSVRTVTVSPVGMLVIGAGIALNVAGWRWMRRLIAKAMR
jgi:tight adherence protein B